MSTDPAAQTAANAQAAAPAPVLMAINVRQATNGFILSAQFSRAVNPLMTPQNEYVFATGADMLAWIKTQGWNL